MLERKDTNWHRFMKVVVRTNTETNQCSRPACQMSKVLGAFLYWKLKQYDVRSRTDGMNNDQASTKDENDAHAKRLSMLFKDQGLCVPRPRKNEKMSE